MKLPDLFQYGEEIKTLLKLVNAWLAFGLLYAVGWVTIDVIRFIFNLLFK